MDTKRTPQRRQAVVIIHGIGEQHPNDTIRSFLRGIGQDKYYNKPQKLSQNLELRRFSVSSTDRQPKTDYFELYWAHHLGKGRFFYTLKWAFMLLFRRPFWKHNRQLLGAFAVGQISTILLVGFLLYLLIDSMNHGNLSRNHLIGFGLAAIALILSVGVGSFVTRGLSDGARYTTSEPENIPARNEIRAEGLNLLFKLHEDGSYDRIIVVGHSLGSVIGLDILRLAWDELRHPSPEYPQDTTFQDNFEELARTLPRYPSGDEVKKWQEAQHKLWLESRLRGMRWLVTDFITLGSPLAHASLVFGGDEQFRVRKDEREYPTCPPSFKGGYFYESPYLREDGGDSILEVAHHGAPFAVTRWSNAYFPIRWGFGDPVGGPLADTFGGGIRDVRVRVASRRLRAFRGLFIVAHSSYWNQQFDPDHGVDTIEVLDACDALDHRSGTRVARETLAEFLDLTRERVTSYPLPAAVEMHLNKPAGQDDPIGIPGSVVVPLHPGKSLSGTDTSVKDQISLVPDHETDAYSI